MKKKTEQTTTFVIRIGFRGVGALAKELGVTRWHLSGCLNGRRYPGPRLAAELAARGIPIPTRTTLPAPRGAGRGSVATTEREATRLPDCGESRTTLGRPPVAMDC